MTALPDYLQAGLRVVFVGFNPGARSALLGHYYAGPGNLFWPLLYEAGLIPHPFTYQDDHRVVDFGIGLTDLVKRSSRSSAELTAAETRAGTMVLRDKLLTYAPLMVCFNGKGVYAWYSGRDIPLGLQEETIGTTKVFVVPSTSARNGHWRRAQKAAYFHALRRLLDE